MLLHRLFSIVPLISSAISAAIQTDYATLNISSLPPSEDIFNDSFYTPPPGFQSAQAGQILRHRRVPRALALQNTINIHPKEAWQILYRTQDSLGKPEATVVTVLVPYRAKKGNLFVHSYFTDASFAACNPSYALQMGNRPDNMYTQVQMSAVLAALNQGWYVSIADDSGPQASFPAGPQLAYATLDSIRAVQQSGHFTGISSKPITTITGYSGGGVSAAWTGEIHPLYAPELDIAGIALGGLAVDISGIMAKADISAIPSMLGFSHDYPELATWLDTNLVPSKAADFRNGEKQCMTGRHKFAEKTLGDYFKGGMKSLLAEDVPLKIAREAGVMGKRATPKAPWYLYESIADPLTPINVTDKLVQQYCRKGAHIHYERNLIPLDHSSESYAAFPGAFKWMQTLHAGIPAVKGCIVTPVTLQSIIAAGTGLAGRSIMQDFLALLGVPIHLLGL